MSTVEADLPAYDSGVLTANLPAYTDTETFSRERSEVPIESSQKLVDPQTVPPPIPEEECDTETPHFYTHGDASIARAKLHEEAISLAFSAGAHTAGGVKRMLPNLPCSLLFIASDNIQRPYLIFHRPDCATCCEEAVSQLLVADTPGNKPLRGALGFLREKTKEVIMREDCTWDILKEDKMLVALYRYPPRRYKNPVKRGLNRLLEGAKFFWTGRPDPLSGRRYIEDLDFWNGEYTVYGR